jgi:hypothetical protein
VTLAITPATKVAELLEAYPELEETLIGLAPAFARLRNPVLRRTVARVASLEQAASVGGVSVRELVAALRAAAGQEPDGPGEGESPVPDSGPAPGWLDESRVATVIDADALLDDGEVPLARVVAAAAALATGTHLRVDSGFRPTPLIDALSKQGHPSHVRQDRPGRFSTYVAPARDTSRGEGPVS